MDLVEEIEFPNWRAHDSRLAIRYIGKEGQQWSTRAADLGRRTRLRACAVLVQAPERTRKMAFEVSMEEVDHHMESKRQTMVKQAVGCRAGAEPRDWMTGIE